MFRDKIRLLGGKVHIMLSFISLILANGYGLRYRRIVGFQSVEH